MSGSGKAVMTMQSVFHPPSQLKYIAIIIITNTRRCNSPTVFLPFTVIQTRVNGGSATNCGEKSAGRGLSIPQLNSTRYSTAPILVYRPFHIPSPMHGTWYSCFYPVYTNDFSCDPSSAWSCSDVGKGHRQSLDHKPRCTIERSPSCGSAQYIVHTMLTAQQTVYVLPVNIAAVPFWFPSLECVVLSHRNFQDCNNKFQPNWGLLCWFPMRKRAGWLSVPFTPRWIPSWKRGPGPSSHSGGAVQRNSIR